MLEIFVGFINVNGINNTQKSVLRLISCLLFGCSNVRCYWERMVGGNKHIIMIRDQVLKPGLRVVKILLSLLVILLFGAMLENSCECVVVKHSVIVDGSF